MGFREAGVLVETYCFVDTRGVEKRGRSEDDGRHSIYRDLVATRGCLKAQFASGVDDVCFQRENLLHGSPGPRTLSINY